jgi:hypothetical protein
MRKGLITPNVRKKYVRNKDLEVRDFLNCNEAWVCIESEEFLRYMRDYKLLKKVSTSWSWEPG